MRIPLPVLIALVSCVDPTSDDRSTTDDSEPQVPATQPDDCAEDSFTDAGGILTLGSAQLEIPAEVFGTEPQTVQLCRTSREEAQVVGDIWQIGPASLALPAPRRPHSSRR